MPGSAKVNARDRCLAEQRGELVDSAAPAERVSPVGAALVEGSALAGDLGAVHAHPHVLGVILKGERGGRK